MYKQLLKALWCIFAISFVLSLQAQNTVSLQDSLYKYVLISPVKTQYFAEQIQPIYKKENQWENYLFCYYDIAQSYYYQSDYYQSDKYLDKALEEGKSSPLPKSNIVYSLILNLKGLLAYIKGNFYRATEYYSASLDIDNQQTNVDDNMKATKYVNLASAYDEFGDYNRANAYYNKALSLTNETNFNTRARIYNGLGFVNSNLKEYNKAQINYEKGLLIFEEHGFNGKSLLLNLAELHIHKKEYDKALEYLAQRLQLPKLTQRNLAANYENIGTVLFKQQDYNRALDTIQVALRIRKEVLPKKHHVLGQTHFLLGNIFKTQKDYSKALESYQKAIQSVVFDFDNDNININPSLNNVLHQVELLKALSAKGDIQRLMDKNEEALNTYQVCSKLIDKMRTSFQSDASKLFLMEEGIQIYEKAIRTALKVGDNEMAFQFSEKSKAVLLLEAFRGIEARFGLPQEIVQQEQDFKSDITFYERKIWEEKQKDKSEAEKIKNWESIIFDLKEAYTKLKQQIKEDYQDYFQLQYNTAVASVKDIQRQLLDNETSMLSYFFGDSTIYIFHISKRNIEVKTIQYPNNLQQDINNLRRFLQRDPTLKDAHLVYYQTAFQLYETFVLPAIESSSAATSRLVIIPDDVLNYIPFEALLTTQSNLKNARYEFKKMPYLIKDYQISYGYSATLLLEGLQKKKGENIKDFGGFAPSFSGTIASKRDCADEVLGDLVYGRENLEVINTIMQGNLHFNQEATLQNFKEIANQYNVLHLCTHACAAGDFQDTRIYFSDEALLGFELYNLPLNAQLAVLSACETGVGEIKKGEGVMSLARAFMYAGCPSVVMSLWSVDDKSTSELMQLFYKNLKEGQSKSAALHQAKLAYLEGKGIEASHPFYWSGFVQIGNTEVIYGNEWWSSRNLIIVGGILIVILLLFFFYKKRTM